MLQRRVLIVEDNQDAADSLRMFLELLGLHVRVAYNGQDGVREAIAWKPDVVLSDIGLPGLDGYAVAREIRGNPLTAGARLIAITGYDDPESLERSRKAGFEYHLVKPADPGVLVRILARTA